VRVRWLLGAFFLFLLAVGGSIAAIRAATSGGTHADAETGGVVVFGPISIAVEGEIPGFDLAEVTVWQARPSPEPMFDISSLGPDRSFVAGRPSVAALTGLEGDVVYLGDRDGTPMIIHARAATQRNPWDHVYTFVMGRGDRRLLDATFPCCAFSYGGDEITPGIRATPDGGLVVQWLGTPASTSVVALAIDGEPVGFQRPVGGVVVMEIGASLPSLLVITALDASGTVLATTGLGPVPGVDTLRIGNVTGFAAPLCSVPQGADLLELHRLHAEGVLVDTAGPKGDPEYSEWLREGSAATALGRLSDIFEDLELNWAVDYLRQLIVVTVDPDTPLGPVVAAIAEAVGTDLRVEVHPRCVRLAQTRDVTAALIARDWHPEAADAMYGWGVDITGRVVVVLDTGSAALEDTLVDRFGSVVHVSVRDLVP
jgi:hypothetical protein